MLRSKPNRTERIDVFLKDNVVAIGWTDTKSLEDTTKMEIKEALISLGYQGQSLLTNLGMVNAFVHSMQEGDLVLIRQGNIVHIGKVGEYKWNDNYEDMRMAHTRSVEWITQVPFKELNASIQSLLKNIKTIAQYSGTLEESELMQYIITDPTENEPAQIKIKDKEALLANTMEILKDLANNAQDEKVRLEATKELLSYLKNS